MIHLSCLQPAAHADDWLAWKVSTHPRGLLCPSPEGTRRVRTGTKETRLAARSTVTCRTGTPREAHSPQIGGQSEGHAEVSERSRSWIGSLRHPPSSPSSRIEPHLFRVLLLRRLRLPLPPVSRTCQCGHPTDVLGHHRAACARAGVLGWRGFALESAAARVSRRRRQSILQRHGERSGLEGARRARRSSPRSRRRRTSATWRGHNWPSTPPWFPLCIVTDPPDLTQPTLMAWHCRREDGGKNSHTPNSWVHAAGPGWWFSLARWVDGGQPRPFHSWACWPKPEHGQKLTSRGVVSSRHGASGGAACWRVRPRVHSQPRCLSSACPSGVTATRR